MTYQEIKELYPEEYAARKNNKLHYRYLGMGESYLDVIHRVNSLIIELERMTDNILIVTHRAVMRIFLAYFLDVEKENVPHMEVPLHTVYCLQPKAYGMRQPFFFLIQFKISLLNFHFEFFFVLLISYRNRIIEMEVGRK